MKSSSRPRTPSGLSDSVHRQLNMYALAASAAGVGVVALSQPAEAKIVYTPANRVIGPNQKYDLALNHKHADFWFSNNQCLGGTFPCSSTAWDYLAVGPVSTPANEVVGEQHWASALKRGAQISKGQHFSFSARMASQCSGIGCTGPRTNGPWVNVTDRYLGLKFKIDGKFHYGWARLNVAVVKGQFEVVATLTGYAYETIPNKPIIAGKTKGPDAIAAQPGSLGQLARGSAGLAAGPQAESANGAR